MDLNESHACRSREAGLSGHLRRRLDVIAITPEDKKLVADALAQVETHGSGN